LKLTAFTAPGGLRADGSDVALIDVEAVDATGERAPTFQQRVDFETGGPGVWRGGYNSGKINSINHPFLDLEAGINRVAIRATRTPGTITVRAQSAGLRPGSVTIVARPFGARDGFSTTPPAATPAPLPAQAPQRPAFTTTPTKSATGVKAAAMVGKFIKNLNYTGPTAPIVHVETNARDGRSVYADREYTFSGLPTDLVGADWIQVADADQRYSAADLIELAVTGGTVLTIAHDARISVPQWLARQFQATDRAIEVNGKPMTLFTRRVDQDASLTLGSNNDAAPAPANMYVVLVNAAK
jgi:beta-galactosidase